MRRTKDSTAVAARHRHFEHSKVCNLKACEFSNRFSYHNFIRFIFSFMGGINFWGGSRKDDIFLAPNMDDRVLEVVAVFGTAQMAASRFINLQHHRIAQCSVIQITILGKYLLHLRRSLPVTDFFK